MSKWLFFSRVSVGLTFVLGACGGDESGNGGDLGQMPGGDVPAAPTPIGTGSDPLAMQPPAMGPTMDSTTTDMGTPMDSGADPTMGGTAGTENTGGTGGDDVMGDGDATAGDGDAAGDGDGDGDAVDPSTLENFSFFVTSLEIMRELSGSQDGFGGDLGGIAGADGICQQAADAVGFGAKTWRAFLSAHDDGTGNPVNAIDRIGDGPWYDRNGRLIAQDRAGLLSGDRPAGDAQTINDLPNEYGEGLQQFGDTHDVITASNRMGQLDNPDDPATSCDSWRSTTVDPGSGFGGFPGFPGGDTGGGGGGGVRVGHSWPAGSGMHWVTAHTASSCAAGVNLVQNGPGDGSSIGAGGGWGGIYCFALQP